MKIAGVQLAPAIESAVLACRRHFIAAAAFSFFINLLYLAPPIYMLQVYDRVVATGGKLTLLFITLALGIALLTLSALDGIRARLLLRASVRLDTIIAPKILKRGIASNGSGASAINAESASNLRRFISSLPHKKMLISDAVLKKRPAVYAAILAAPFKCDSSLYSLAAFFHRIFSRSVSVSFASSMTFNRIWCSVAGTLSQRHVADQSVPNRMRSDPILSMAKRRCCGLVPTTSK